MKIVDANNKPLEIGSKAFCKNAGKVLIITKIGKPHEAIVRVDVKQEDGTVCIPVFAEELMDGRRARTYALTLED